MLRALVISALAAIGAIVAPMVTEARDDFMADYQENVEGMFKP